MSAKHALLGLLLHRPAHPYELGERLEERLGPAWALNSGQLYRTIRQAEKEGLVELVEDAEPDQEGRHVRRINGTGVEEFERWFEEPTSRARLLRRPLMIKLTFAGPERLENVLRQIDAYESECTARIKELSEQLEEVPPGGSRVRADQMVLRFALNSDIGYLSVELDWCRDLRELVSWLRGEHVVWTPEHGRPGGSSDKARDHQGARKELFDRMATRKARPISGEQERGDG